MSGVIVVGFIYSFQNLKVFWSLFINAVKYMACGQIFYKDDFDVEFQLCSTVINMHGAPIFVLPDLGPCTCDLTRNSCDVNCCCDEDCSAADRQAFSQCIETLTR